MHSLSRRRRVAVRPLRESAHELILCRTTTTDDGVGPRSTPQNIAAQWFHLEIIVREPHSTALADANSGAQRPIVMPSDPAHDRVEDVRLPGQRSVCQRGLGCVGLSPSPGESSSVSPPQTPVPSGPCAPSFSGPTFSLDCVRRSTCSFPMGHLYSVRWQLRRRGILEGIL